MTLMAMYSILKEHYTLGELEERLDATTDELEDGLETYIREHEIEVAEMLKEDLWL